MPNFEFLTSTVPEIRRGSQNSKIGSHDPIVTPLTQFFIFSLVPLGVHLHAKFRVSSFNRSRDMEGSQNSKIGSRDPLVTLIDLIFHFFLNAPRGRLHAKFRVSSSAVPEIWRGSQDSKIRSREPRDPQ